MFNRRRLFVSLPAVLVAGFVALSGGPHRAYADSVRFQCADLFRSDAVTSRAVTSDAVTSDRVTRDAAYEFLSQTSFHSNVDSYAPVISPREFTSLENYHYSGIPLMYFTATYRGKKVFLKSKPKANLKNSERPEGVWLTFLNMLGMGPQFLGVTVINGRSYLVTEFIEGDLSKFVGKSGPDARLTHEKIEEIKRQLRILEGFRIFASDAQFIFRENGSVTIFDPELWTIITRTDANSLREIQVEHGYQVDGIKLDWLKAGKLADYTPAN